jgi:hypothetical protein
VSDDGAEDHTTYGFAGREESAASEDEEVEGPN